MKIAKFASFVLAVLCGVSMVSCHKIGEKDSEDIVEKTVTFTVAINSGSVESNYAEVIVRHDGKDSDTWYGFLTDDLVSKEDELIAAVLPSVSKENLHLGTVQTVAVPHLDEYAVYRYIAFGVKENKELYGKPGSLTFTTNPNLDVTFGVEVSDITTNSAKANISSTSEKYKYYGFVTDDLTSSADVLAAETLASLVDDQNKIIANIALFQGAASTAPITGLTPDTGYRYIVFGIFVDESGVAAYYGTPAEAEFRTLVDYDIITFSAELLEAKKSQATFEVDYDAESELTWYAFNTADLDTPVADLIAAVHPTADELESGKEVEITIEGLESLTSYRFIVTGIKDGVPYGTPAEVTYETADADYETIEFSAEFLESGQNTAKFKVTHNGGEDRFKWFGFVTEDLDAHVSDLLPAATSIDEADIKSGQELEVTVEGLEPGTVYRYIVAGYREDTAGNKYVYGVPADVVFNTASGYTENEGWNIVYNGKKVASNSGQWRLWFHIEGTGATLGYIFLPKQTYEVFTIVDPLINGYAEEVQAAIAGGDSLSDYTRGDNEGTSSWVFEPQEPGEYVALFFDVDESFAPKGQFKAVPYTIEASEATAAYNAWLGDWLVQDNAGTELWTVSEGVPGETYLINGLCNLDVDVKATFNPTNSTLILFTQGLGDYHFINTSAYGNLEVETYLFGQSSNGIYGGSRTVFTATISGNEATLTPGKDAKGADFTSTWFLLSAKDPSITSLWYADSKDQVTLPQTITRPSDTGSDAYNAWLGDWNIIGRNKADTADSTFFTLNVAQNKANVSYHITGWGGITGANPPATDAAFSTANGSISIKSGVLLTDQSIQGIDGLCDVAVCGFFTYTDGNTYFDSDPGSTLAVATQSGGNVTVNQGEWDTDIYYVKMDMMAMPQGTTSGYRLWSNSLDIPFKMVRANGGSAPAAAPALKASGKQLTRIAKPNWAKETRTAVMKAE